jgi:hypothetical protein
MQKNDPLSVLLVENVRDPQDLANLAEAYFRLEVIIVFQLAHESLRLSVIFGLVQHFPFSDNYLSKFAGHSFPEHLQDCLARRSFDYELYAASRLSSLEELCSM